MFAKIESGEHLFCRKERDRMGFQRAQRRRVHLKMGVTGPSGSGKTYSALLLAFGLAGDGGRVAVIDTENGSASLYAHLGEYDVSELEPPYTVARYVEAMGEAARAGYDVLVIDSVSHEWAGDGGLLHVKENLDARGGNSFANWAKVSPLHEQFKAALLQAPLHVIVTLRSKQDYVMQDDGKGRTVPVKVGLSPVQRDGFEYELSLVFDLAMSHEAVTSKDRTGLFDGVVGRITADHGRRLRDWIESAAEAVTPAPTTITTAPAEDPVLRRAKLAFADAARSCGYDVTGDGGRPSLARMTLLLRRVLATRPLPDEPTAADWDEGRVRLPIWAGRTPAGAGSPT
jgi:hypothetical protein